MVNDELFGYVRKQLSLNIPKETVVANLKGAGWTDEDVGEVFLVLDSTSTASAIPPSPIASPLDFSLVSETAPHIHKSKKLLSAVIVLVFLALAGGAAAYAYYTGSFVSLPNLIENSFDEAKLVKSYSHNFSFDIDFSGIRDQDTSSNPLSVFGTGFTKLVLNIKGSTDMADKSNLKSSSTFSFNMGLLSAEIEMRLINNILYAKLTKAPVLDVLSSEMLVPYKDRWFSFSKEMMEELSALRPSTKNQLTAEQSEYIFKIFKDAHIIKPISKLATETIDGTLSYHFSFDFDKNALVSFAKSMMDYLKSVAETNPELSAFDQEAFSKGLDAIKDFRGEIWIGRNNKLVSKITLDFGIQPDKAKDEQVKINATGIMSNWNEPVTIVAPSESVPFMSLLGASLNSARQKGNEAAIKSTLSMLRANAEIFWDKTSNAGNSYNGSYAGFCKSKELKDARVFAESAGGTNFVCRDTVQAYVISTKMPQSSGYWCVDSTGMSLSTKVTPEGTACPL